MKSDAASIPQVTCPDCEGRGDDCDSCADTGLINQPVDERSAASMTFEWYEGKIHGAHIVEVERHGDRHLRLHFEHRGTDDDSGVLVVSLDGIHFDDEADRA